MQTKEQNPDGLHQKYLIKKITGWRQKYKTYGDLIPITKAVDKHSEYFVLRLDAFDESKIEHVKACRKAIHTYADAIEPTIPQLAKDLRARYPLF